MKETRITVPEGYEVEKIEPIEGAIIVTYKEKQRKLPKSWEEFCEMFSDAEGEFLVSDDSDIYEYTSLEKRNSEFDRNLLPDYATAEAVLALCQLIQLRNCFNGDWVPDWSDERNKFIIGFHNGHIETWSAATTARILYFKSEELRDEFLRNFRNLIEKLKPLYGIKEGGNE